MVGFTETNTVGAIVTFESSGSRYLAEDSTFKTIPTIITGTNAFFYFDNLSTQTALTSTASKKTLVGFTETNTIGAIVTFESSGSRYLAEDGSFKTISSVVPTSDLNKP